MSEQNDQEVVRLYRQHLEVVLERAAEMAEHLAVIYAGRAGVLRRDLSFIHAGHIPTRGLDLDPELNPSATPGAPTEDPQ